MNVQLVTNVAGNQEYIELFGTDSLNLSISFAEIQDITKKNSNYSKEFNVPGTNQNNYIFNYYFDFNQVPLDFIPSKKFEAWITYNGYIILSGYIRLNYVTIEKEQKFYNVTFYSGVGDVAATIGDKFMRQLDLSHLSHPWNIDVPYYSQYDPNLVNLTGATNYSYENGKTFWGVFNIGYEYSNSISGAGYSDYYYFTGTTTIPITSGDKEILAIYNAPCLPPNSPAFAYSMYRPGDTIRLTQPSNGYFIQGIVKSLSNDGLFITFTPNLGLGTGNLTNWFAQRILPEGEEINNSTTPLLAWSPRPDNNENLYPVPTYWDGPFVCPLPIRSFYPKPAIQIRELYEQIFNQAGYKIESNFLNTNYFEKYYLPLKFSEDLYTEQATTPCYNFSASSFDLYALAGTYYLNPLSGNTCNNVPLTANTNTIFLPSYYEGKMKWKFTWTEQNLATCVIQPYPYLFFVWTDGTLPANIVISAATVCSIADQSLELEIQVPSTKQLQFAMVGDQVRITNFKAELISASKILVTGTTIDYANEFPIDEFKQIDFITSVNKMFNFVCVPHPTKQKTIIVEPMIDYIGKGEILDWTDKIDWDSPITVSPTTSIINGTLNYNFALDQDYVNQQFKIGNNRTFGTYQLQLNTEFKDNVTNFDTIFASPTDYLIPNYAVDAVKLTAPSLFSIKTKDTKSQSILRQEPYKVLPRMVFRGTQIPIGNWAIREGNPPLRLNDEYAWNYENYYMQSWQSVNRFNTYPFSYTGFSHYINFDAKNKFYDDETIFPTQQDMYDIYYYDYISDLTSPENKIISAKIYLTPFEIANLRFDEKIIVKNGYYRINKISNYNIVEPSLCDIELVKLTKSYTPHPVMYFDLISCTGGTNYHTTSDLNYNMYAFVDNFVKLYSGSTSLGCYEVTIGQPNPNYDYEKVTIANGAAPIPNPFTGDTRDYSSQVQVFQNTGCTIYTDFVIVQQEYS